MSRLKQSALCAISLIVLVLAGCSTTAEPRHDSIEAQRGAMERWNACLERNAASPKITAMRINHVLKHTCEGHKRDVIASFPKHMATQVDQLLISNAYQLLDNNENSVELSGQQGELFQTLLR